ncbi:hypothetical protein BD289DRAFT_137650 [Coniella lustricola]|uniref:Uncharacterized protein n=1 Tax=Coniella lustricola TaxID=2025994 RepID=A0A2T2ZVJ9_9PEZI|nr:hypothetical protein BD289DRAFT_137650 [Coniella lustricola]
MNTDEDRVIAMPSRNVEIRVSVNEDLRRLTARILRREGYFRAILVHSRGHPSNSPCANKCARNNGVPFSGCVRLPDFQDGACSACVWASSDQESTKRYTEKPLTLGRAEEIGWTSTRAVFR